ncbi:hypothetical protein B0H17DRAFT_1111450 [Mycena rosella]|uniref:Uncharacterized protein n=1 Tax=Mycena rosella TaxID=1033263 RepID=A0AAD7BM22_MYCRO|nr:hypothetical protein B0H17DRAFT_1111450 [Mycena rosella]
MLTRKFEDSAPLLVRMESTGESIHRHSSSREKDFDSNVLLESPIPVTPPTQRRRGFSSRLIGWPAAVILGQLLLQLMGWGFFIIVKARGQLALPFNGALWVKNNPHVVTLLATLLATILGGCSSFLFSYAIRRSMSLYLNRPISLATLGASVRISMRSVVFHRRNLKWPAISFLLFLLAGIQTSGWSTLLTPVTLTVSTPLVGADLNLSSPILYEMFNTGELDFCVRDQGNRKSLFPTETESGYAAARAILGQPSSFMLMDQVFNVSTGGVLPAYLTAINASAWFTTTSIIPVVTHDVSPRRPDHGFTTNYSMIQQGFSADVSCSFRNLTNDTIPSLWRESDSVKKWHNLDINTLGRIHYSAVGSACEGLGNNSSEYGYNSLNWTYAYTTSSMNWLMLIACGPADNYTLVIMSDGDYDWIPMTVCSVTPKTTTVQVDYTPGINVVVDPNGLTVMDPEGPAGLSAISTLFNMVFFYQATESSLLADQLTALSVERKEGAADILAPLEEYIRGVIEYSGSVFRACLASNTSFMDTVSPSMIIPTNGTFRTETLGWTYTSGATHWVLVPGTLIAVATIAVVIGALSQPAGDVPAESEQFDPSDPLHLMAAAAAGGLNNAFTGLGTKDMKEGEKLKVVLGSIPGRGPALVRADQYRPMLWDS